MINKILGCQQINKSIINSYPKFGVSSKITPSSNGYTMLWVEVESVYSNRNTSAIWPQPNIPNWFSIGITTVEHSSMVVLLLTVKEPSIMDVPSPKYVYQRLYHRFWPLVDISIYLITYSNSERPRFILYSCHLVHSSCTELFQDRGPNKVVDSHIQKKSLLRLRWKKKSWLGYRDPTFGHTNIMTEQPIPALNPSNYEDSVATGPANATAGHEQMFWLQIPGREMLHGLYSRKAWEYLVEHMQRAGKLGKGNDPANEHN